jgi:hypothetical protein
MNKCDKDRKKKSFGKMSFSMRKCDFNVPFVWMHFRSIYFLVKIYSILALKDVEHAK